MFFFWLPIFFLVAYVFFLLPMCWTLYQLHQYNWCAQEHGWLWRAQHNSLNLTASAFFLQNGHPLNPEHLMGQAFNASINKVKYFVKSCWRERERCEKVEQKGSGDSRGWGDREVDWWKTIQDALSWNLDWNCNGPAGPMDLHKELKEREDHCQPTVWRC